jgi:oxygen-dependent protoporphyrinogen oxidase
LYKDLILTSKSSPAARNRFIYYPDHLVQLPAPDPKLSFVDNIKRFKQSLDEPLFENLVSGIFKDLLSPPRHPTDWAKDESVADFIGRRFGTNVAENVVSAVMHGIYAGDIDQLSAQTMLGPIRNLEGGIGGIGGFVSGGVIGSLISRAFTKTKTRSVDDYMAVDAISAGAELVKRQHSLETLMAEASTFTFKGGVGQLCEALAASLKASPKVKILKNMEIQSLRKLRDSSSISV